MELYLQWQTNTKSYMIYRTASISTTSSADFKVTPLFDAEYLRNGARYRHSFSGILIMTFLLLRQGWRGYVFVRLSLSFVLSVTVSRITHERGNGRRPNMVGMDNERPSTTGYFLVLIRMWMWMYDQFFTFLNTARYKFLTTYCHSPGVDTAAA